MSALELVRDMLDDKNRKIVAMQRLLAPRMCSCDLAAVKDLISLAAHRTDCEYRRAMKLIGMD